MSHDDSSTLARLRSALGSYSRMVLHLDADGVLVWLNDAALERLRAERVAGGVLGRSFVSLTPSLTEGSLASVLRAVRLSGLEQRFQQAFPSGLVIEFTVLPADEEFLLFADDVSPLNMQIQQDASLTALLEASDGVLWIFDPADDTIVMWTGDPADEDGGRNVQPWTQAIRDNAVPEHDCERIREGQRATLEAGVPFDVAYSVGVQPHRRRYQSRGARVQLDGRPQIVGMSIDVTGLESTERAAQETHQRFLRASEALDLGLWEIDHATGWGDFSPVAQKLFGVQGQRQRLQDFNLAAQVHPDDVVALGESWRACAEDGQPYKMSFRVRGEDGEAWRWVYSVGERVSGQGDTAKVAGWTRDITQEHRLNALHQVTEEVAMIGGWLLDVASGEVFWTAGTYRVAGRDPTLPLPNRGDILSLHAPEERERVNVLLLNALQAGESFSYDATLLRADGSRRRVHVRGEPALQDGVVFQVVGAIQDITARQELETELRRSQRLDSLGRMAGGVAHDFNNVLAAISGNAELILSMDSLQHTKELAEEVLVATGRGNALTRQMIGFARDGTTHSGEPGTEVVAATQQVVGMLHRLLPTSVELVVEVHEGPLHVPLDDGRFEQVLMNLILNARDAVEGAGTIQVTVEPLAATSSESSTGGWVRLRVEDDGAGMAPDTQERMFEPFFTTRPSAGGTGLGLATVYRVVNSVGGRLQVRSAVHAGTSIEAHLPACLPPQAPVLPTPRVPAAKRGQSILVAEDDDVVLRMISRVLRRAGYDVAAVVDGAAAFAWAIERGVPDLLITDVDMPGLTGVELSVLLRARRPDLPLVFISSHHESALPFDDERVCSFSKPFSVEALEHAVAELLGL